MLRLGGGLLLVVCAGLASAAVEGHVRLAPKDAPGSAVGARGVDGSPGAGPAHARVWADDHVMVAPNDPAELPAIAAAIGARVARGVGPAGYGAVTVPPGWEPRGVVERLRADARVRDAAPDALTRGAGRGGRSALVPRRARWHMLASNAPADGDARGIIVALLDTGVAYEDRVDGEESWRRAPALAGVRFVSPWDFINGDAHPNDDHQHGTHLASLVAAGGPYTGMAPGVSIMPIKVLDRENVGTELALVDGIRHAVRHGADIINMSLSFGRGYVPSKALVDALEDAHAAGAVLVAAAGNDGGDYVAQPAANPLVIAVGANRPEGVDVYGAAPYSNASPRVDLVAPGGSVDRDRDEDGLLDGVIGETIALQDPSRTGYWLYAGTSQATALVSGAAARLLAAGHRPEEVRVLLQASAADESYIQSPWLDGRGRGRLDVGAAVALGASPEAPVSRDLSVALLGWLAPEPAGGVRPMARVTVLDERLLPVPGALVVGTFTGTRDVPFSCLTDAVGACVARGPAQADARGAAWTISADDVVLGKVSHHPRAALYTSDGLQALVSALGDREPLAGAVPAWRWRAQEHATLGPIADGIVVGNLGRGVATSPQVLVATPGALGAPTLLESGTLDVGVPASASPRVDLRAREAPLCDAGPTAYEVLHFATAGVTALVLDASGHAGATLDVSAPAVLGGLGGAPGALPAQPVTLSRPLGTCADPDFARSPLGRVLASGGWTAHGGEPAASALAAGVGPDASHAHVAGSAGPR